MINNAVSDHLYQDHEKHDVHTKPIILVIAPKCLQIKVPSLQSRCFHSVTSLSLTPGLTVVTIFGGCSKEVEEDDLKFLANTTIVLKFGESPLSPRPSLIASC